jgi:anaerobic selenocysteine-containing dehydrogenase
MALVHSVCNFCHVRCPTLVDVQDDRVASLEPDKEHPYGGLLCVKGKAAGELLEHPDRVLYPLKRVGPKTASSPSPLPPGGESNSQWVRVSWDEALADIAAQLLRLRAEHGPETIVFSKGTRSGTGLVDAERWLKRLSNLLGTPNTVATTHLCQWPRDEGTRYTFGVRMPTPDLERAGCFLLWGCNPSTTNIRMAHDIQVARARGMKLVTVDPRRVGVAAQSDVHLAVQPGTDGALALSLAHVLVESGRFDEAFVRHWTNAPLLVRPDLGRLLRWSDLTGRAEDAADFVAWSLASPLLRRGKGRVTGQAGAPVRYATESGEYEIPPHPDPLPAGAKGTAEDRLDLDASPTVRLADGAAVATATVFHLVRELLHDYPPERTAEITGVPATSISAAADLLAAHRPVAHYFWNGITQHTNAAQNGRAISLLYALLGDFDAPGGNVITPRPAIADVELNSLLGPDELERRLGWEERPLGAPRTSGSSAAYDVYRAVLEGDPYRVRALLAFGTNMVMTNGGSLEGRAALEQLEFMVCVDYFLTPTAQLADYVLPAATFLEALSLVTGWELPIPAQTHLQYRPPAVSARGEARSDTQIIFDLAVRLGFGDQFWQGDLAAAFRHELEPSGITLAELHQQPLGIQSKPGTAPPSGHSYARNAKRGFNTPTRKVELYATPFAAHGQNPLPAFEAPHWSAERQPDVAAAYPFVLTNAKVTQFCHGQHRALPSLRRARPHPEVELHPETAAQAGVAKGAWVAVETPEGAIRARVRLNAAIKPGVVVGQHGWWQECPELGLPGYSPYTADGANVNLLISNRWRDPISGGTPFRSGRCRLRSVDAPAS